MLSTTNREVIQSILDQIEDQLLIVGSEIPDTVTIAERSRILLDSLTTIINDITEAK